MKKDFITLMDNITHIESKFRHFEPSKGVFISSKDLIYDVPEFIEWKEAILYELQDIYERTNDTYVWKLINATGILNKFDGKYDERKIFNELKSALKVIYKNIDKYYPKINNESENNGMKETKIFISHSSKDINFVQPFVELLADIGLNNNTLFCSSTPGYGIPLGKNIYDYLATLFHDYNLYVIFMLSQNYYNSPACLNEMGAAWVLKNDYISILLPKFDYQEIKGAVNPNNIGLKLDAENGYHKKELLGDLKNIIVSKLNITIPDIRWEIKRDNFIKEIMKINNAQIKNETKELS